MSPSLELQTLIRETLIANPEVQQLIGDRIYDGQPIADDFPYVTFGPSDVDPTYLEGVDACTEAVQLDIWDRSNGRLGPCKEIMNAIRAALHLADLSLSVNALVRIEIVGQRVFRDSDGLTAHGVVTVSADLEVADG